MKKNLLIAGLLAALLLAGCGKPSDGESPVDEGLVYDENAVSTETEDAASEKDDPNVTEDEGGMGGDEDESEELAPEKTEFSFDGMDEADILFNCRPCLEAYASVVDEGMLCEADFTSPYQRIYREEIWELVGKEDLTGRAEALIIPGETDNIPEGCVLDGAVADLYKIGNFSSIKELSDHFAALMDKSIYETELTEFDEFGGELYLVRGGRGYGNYYVDLDTADVVAQNDDGILISLEWYGFDEPLGLHMVSFAVRDGAPYITSASELSFEE